MSDRDWETLREKIIGFGEKSIRKSYYPRLQESLAELRRFRKLLDCTDDAIFLVKTPGGELTDANRSACTRLGYSTRDIPGHRIYDLLPEDMHSRFKGILEGNDERITMEGQLIKRNREMIPVEIKVDMVDFDGERYAVLVARDITERLKMEAELRRSLREKEVLLSEIHHRVKNNLQIISSLLSLQSHSINDPTCRDILEESQDRIRSMGLIHEQLYRSGDFSSIDFGVYASRLLKNLQRSYSHGKDIEFSLEANDIKVSLETSIPLGLILSELVTNALKHAFRGRDRGSITVRFKRRDSACILEVMDDGVGFIEEDLRNSKSLGFKLVEILTEQLEGTLTFSGSNGGLFRIEFREPPYTNRISLDSKK
ncbi:histidine kinase dimerization/phosphoacceptor domain -containing protein [Methanothermobacter sp.]|uniref:sensor histidine kinase n=1 Tax=Methanothermobacter sp. TaxID=1884223 RepID=UPI00260752DC|nr:histidine kinase dimerization/phosphoacceptor domain -containing protein [Methanothermobacter sp.]MDI9614369.1 histidine kinase dimerization/phosphoacceptor domain -containing protein [Methanothermobacter sp.]